jgi:hypothetical protein
MPVGVIRPLKVIAIALSAGFRLLAQRASPRPLGSSERVAPDQGFHRRRHHGGLRLRPRRAGAARRDPITSRKRRYRAVFTLTVHE